MKHVTRLVLLLAASALLFGCPDDPKPGAPAPTMSDAQAIVGSWVQGQDRFQFNADGTFLWDMVRPCGAPPCPAKRLTGNYKLANGTMTLSSSEGDKVLQYRINQSPHNLWVKSADYRKEWTLPFKR